MENELNYSAVYVVKVSKTVRVKDKSNGSYGFHIIILRIYQVFATLKVYSIAITLVDLINKDKVPDDTTRSLR